MRRQPHWHGGPWLLSCHLQRKAELSRKTDFNDVIKTLTSQMLVKLLKSLSRVADSSYVVYYVILYYMVGHAIYY